MAYGMYSNNTYTDPRFQPKKKATDPPDTTKFGLGLFGQPTQPAKKINAPAVGLGSFAQTAPAAPVPPADPAQSFNFTGKLAPGADQTNVQQGGQNFGLGIWKGGQPGGGVSTPGGPLGFSPDQPTGTFDPRFEEAIGKIYEKGQTNAGTGGGTPPLDFKVRDEGNYSSAPFGQDPAALARKIQPGLEQEAEKGWIDQSKLTDEAGNLALDKFNALIKELAGQRGIPDLEARIKEMLGIYDEQSQRTLGRYGDQLAVQGMKGTANLKQGLTSMGKDLALGAAEIPEKMRQYNEGLAREDLDRALSGTSKLTGQMGEMGRADTAAERGYQGERRTAGLEEQKFGLTGELGRGELALQEKQFAHEKDIDDYLKGLSQKYDSLDNVENDMRELQEKLQQAAASGDTGMVKVYQDSLAALKKIRDAWRYGAPPKTPEDDGVTNTPPVSVDKNTPAAPSTGPVNNFWTTQEGRDYLRGSKEARQQLWEQDPNLYNSMVTEGVMPDDAQKAPKNKPQAGEEGYNPYGG